LGCSDVSTESTLLSVDDDSTATSRCNITSGEDSVHLDFIDALREELARVVVTDATNESNITIEVNFLEDVVASTGRVEGSTTKGDLLIVSSEEFVVDAHVFLSDEGSLSVDEAELSVDDIVVVLDGDVEEGVLDDDECDFVGLHC